MRFTMVPVDPKTATRPEWTRYHAFRRARHAERDPDDPLLGDEAVERMMQRDDPFGIAIRHVVLGSMPERQLAELTFEIFRPETPSYEANKDLAFVGLEVLGDHRRQGVGTALLRKAAALAREHGKSILAFWTEEDDGKGFMKSIHAPVAQMRRENRLYLARVDWSMVRQWVEDGPLRSPASRLEWARDRISDDVLEEFARAFTEVFNQQPFDDFALGKLVFGPGEIREGEARIASVGGTMFAAYTREPDGRVSGLTEVWRFPDTKEMVGQGMTGVREAFRGRGLGKWLKAAMLLRIRDEFPEARFIGTGNASSNEAMLSINERLGFRVHREPILFQTRLETLEEYLATAKTGARLEGAT